MHLWGVAVDIADDPSVTLLHLLKVGLLWNRLPLPLPHYATVRFHFEVAN